jgi:hypothetical protein
LQKHPKIITREGSPFESEILHAGYSRDPYLGPVKEYSPSVDQGFIAIQLFGPRQSDVANLPSYAPFEAFGHKVFPLYTVKASQESPPNDDAALLQIISVNLTIGYLGYKARKLTPSRPNLTDQFSCSMFRQCRI